MEIISVTVISSWDASKELVHPSDKGFSPEDFSTTLKVRNFHETKFRYFVFFLANSGKFETTKYFIWHKRHKS